MSGEYISDAIAIERIEELISALRTRKPYRLQKYLQFQKYCNTLTLTPDDHGHYHPARHLTSYGHLYSDMLQIIADWLEDVLHNSNIEESKCQHAKYF